MSDDYLMSNPITIGATNMPVGTILFWATDNDLKTSNDTEEWMICDGRELPEGVTGQVPDYRTLYERIGQTFGDGPGSTHGFNIPDLRGLFVRGTNTAGKEGEKTGPYYDPDATSRVAMQQGGAMGDKVGSVQRDQFRSHRHDISMSTIPTQAQGDWVFTMDGDNHDHTRFEGGNETRPVNAYLNYLIRAK